MYAACYRNAEVITLLLKAGADLKARTKAGGTALMCAAEANQNPQVITTLLKAGVDIKARDDAGRTALMFATRS